MDVTAVLGGRRESVLSAEDVIAQVDFNTPTGKPIAGCAASAGSSDDEVSRGRVTLSVYFSPVKWPRGNLSRASYTRDPPHPPVSVFSLGHADIRKYWVSLLNRCPFLPF